jgi:hypothetical protein
MLSISIALIGGQRAHLTRIQAIVGFQRPRALFRKSDR